TPSSTFTVQFFANAMADPSGSGEGQVFLGSTTASTNSTGDASFQAILPTSVTPGQFISATATDPNNNTSEFAVDVTAKGVFLPPSTGASITATEGAGFSGQVTSFTTDDTTLTASD